MSRSQAYVLGIALFVTSVVLAPIDDAVAKQEGLVDRIASGDDGWSRYRVDIQPGVASPCCYTTDGSGEPKRRGCNLDNVESGVTLGDRARDVGELRLDVYLKSSSGRVTSVRALGSNCPVESNRPIRVVAGVSAADSIALLRSLAGMIDGKRSSSDGSLSALAFHAGEDATLALVAIADSDGPRSSRDSALFWLGQTRGEPGAKKLDAVIASDAPLATKKHAIFSLSQSKVDWKAERLRQIARQHQTPKLRAEAWFWLAQSEGASARADLIAAMAGETDEQVMEHMVFAISQTGEGADAALIQLVEGDASSDVKKRAMFWLGQSGSDEALSFFDRVLSKPARH